MERVEHVYDVCCPCFVKQSNTFIGTHIDKHFPQFAFVTTNLPVIKNQIFIAIIIALITVIRS